MRKHIFCKISNPFTNLCDALSSVFALGIRLYLAQVFMWSGWLKATAWSSTLYLFQNEFKVPLMTPEAAAYLGTTLELILPIFFVIGFGARIPALIFFLFNASNVIFYPALLTPEFICALKDHIQWGVLIGVILFYGYGKISVDYLLQKKVCHEYKY